MLTGVFFIGSGLLFVPMYLLFKPIVKDLIKMANRSTNMKRVNKLRSAEVTAMLDLLGELDNGTHGDFGGFDSFGIESSRQLKGQINSYRAEKLSKLLGKSVSKMHLIGFAKNANYDYSMTSQDFNRFIDSNLEGFKCYWYFSKNVYINNV